MPLLSKRRVVAVKVETTPGTAITLATADAVYATDAKAEPTIEFTMREDDATLGQRTGVIGARKGKISFKLEVKGSGTAGTSPHWALTNLPACGMLETTGTWAPVSAVSSCKTVTVAVYEDGIKKQIHGAMGTVSFAGEAGKPLTATFEYEGIWDAPTDVAMIAPEGDTVKPAPFQASTFTLGSGGSLVVAKFDFKSGNKVMVREDISATYSYDYAVITGREVTGKIDPEATLIATRDVHNEWVSANEEAFSLTLGTVTGNIVTFAAPKAQIKTIAEGDRSSLVTHEIEFQCNKNAGDDEFTIAFG